MPNGLRLGFDDVVGASTAMFAASAPLLRIPWSIDGRPRGLRLAEMLDPRDDQLP